MTPTPAQLYSEIKGLILFMVGKGLVINQRGPKRISSEGGLIKITFSGAEHLAAVSRNSSYEDVYQESVQRGVYSIIMFGGTLVQIQYEFKNRQLQRHRLAFLPNPIPDLLAPDTQEFAEEDDYTGKTAIVWPSAPLRFDFDLDSHVDVLHPQSHLTLGNAKGCRIPVTHPLTPHSFIDFLLRNFFDSEQERYSNGLPARRRAFGKTISDAESKLIHICVPA